jgi:hypothetical protein
MQKLIAIAGTLALAVAYIAFGPQDDLSDTRQAEFTTKPIKSDAVDAENSPSAPAVPLFTGVVNSADPSDWRDITLNITALEAGDDVYLPSPATGEQVRFSEYEITNNRSSTSYSGVVSLNGIERPMTITASQKAVFLTIPTPLGVYRAVGTPSDLKFTRRLELDDYLDPRLLKASERLDLEPTPLPKVTIKAIEERDR